ncbi:30S ribosomal protein S4 [Mycoplasmopsis pullorum]|uniref:Small ribosomal subunit protein uS4 n=1 Tax=Mycoplasmopsis pullorum TaxID=48003 RepID=A0A1L4FS87_9BACT|nr:30S ribosomal protein S4 [Mycoplasmopsis pullorum]APJ38454.1 30S ribosomal protein S4 [Mycoplasmopsis pullorum]TNK82270.1 30S ribosomal protein S4 [Mycoplasmopsis pullorum]TNK82423.1 30S ribosomal protein S4 [Mycoplasmopsis pullorum]TNK82993.1 30S ribosomal protein S4 [Mycoplasmopsis pullorum]TNK84887.1 30S ribosomal protein S4 [Mycoplasmopsis pullorum]
MSRYTGPVFKKSRRLGYSILETGKEFSKGRKRTYAPGQHGNKRVKLSDYGLHLYEKQKIKHVFGINEKQLRKIYVKATKLKGITGTNLLQLLESRLDNLVYRAGFATTRRQARQLVNHGHFTVDGKKADIPSMSIKLGSVIELKEKSQKNVQITEALESKAAAAWLTRKDFTVKYDRLPERNEVHTEIKDALIVEFYAK